LFEFVGDPNSARKSLVNGATMCLATGFEGGPMSQVRSGKWTGLFAGWQGLALLTGIVGLIAFTADFAFFARLVGVSEAKASFLRFTLIGKLLAASFVISLAFWLRFWRSSRSNR
jgi:hypothetical protein